jgi:hypothetical protein
MRTPHYWLRHGGLVSDNQEYLAYDRIVCPVLGKSGEIDHLFGIITVVDDNLLQKKYEDRTQNPRIGISSVD